MRKIIYCDIETSGLDPRVHEVLEVALIEEDGTEHHWFLHAGLLNAEEGALAMNRYQERIVDQKVSHPADVAEAVLEITDDAHLCGANPRFDEEFLRYLITGWLAQEPRWHHRVIDVEAMAMVYLGLRTPPGMSFLCEKGYFDISNEVAHTAIQDAQDAKTIYEHIVNSPMLSAQVV